LSIQFVYFRRFLVATIATFPCYLADCSFVRAALCGLSNVD